MLRLGQSATFKNDYENFKNKIESISNSEVQKDLKILLDRLVYEVKSIDQLHSELSVSNRLPVGTTDTRHNLNSIRLEITKKLKDWEESIK